MTQNELLAELARIKAENDALKIANKVSGRLTFKVSDKGALSIYGMGKFPITFYIEQLMKLATVMPEILAFADAHLSEFTTKTPDFPDTWKAWRGTSASPTVPTPATPASPVPNQLEDDDDDSGYARAQLSDVPQPAMMMGTRDDNSDCPF